MNQCATRRARTARPTYLTERRRVPGKRGFAEERQNDVQARHVLQRLESRRLYGTIHVVTEEEVRKIGRRAVHRVEEQLQHGLTHIRIAIGRFQLSHHVPHEGQVCAALDKYMGQLVL